MKIIQFNAENIKRLTAVEIRPDGNLVEITGKNGQGKTSILDAIWWALDTNKVIQSRPVREGAESAFIRLDLGDYVVTKKFKVKADGDVTIALTVENRDGAKFGSPQELLNKFLGDLTFDPLAFSRMKPADQVKALRALVPDYDFDAADKEAKELFNERTDINRTVRDLQGRIGAIVLPEGDLPQRVDVNDVMAEYQDALSHNEAISQAERKVENFQSEIAKTEESIAEKKQRIKALNDEISALEGAIKHNEQSIEELRDHADGVVIGERIDTDPIRDKLSAADETNAIVARADERAKLQAELEERQAKSDELTGKIDAIKAGSAKAVAAANLPVSGLSLTEEAVMLNGHPFDQASDAEQLRASIAVAGAMNPTLRVIRVRDGSLLDEGSMNLLREYAEQNEYQIWIETVSSGRETAVLIEDGAVSAPALEAAE